MQNPQCSVKESYEPFAENPSPTNDHCSPDALSKKDPPVITIGDE